MPKLICNITGHSYYATDEQIKTKAQALDLPIDQFLKIHICKKASQLLQKGYAIDDIRRLVGSEDAPVLTDEQIAMITEHYMQSNVRRVLSNYTTISSLAVDESDPIVAEYIKLLKKR